MLSLLLIFWLQSAKAAAPDAALFGKAQTLLRAGDLSRAEAAARQFLGSHSNSADAHYLLGSILFLEKKAADSLAEYTEGAKYRTPTAQDLKVVASDYVVLGDFEDADKWFTKLLEWSPNDVQAWYDLGRTKYNENRFEEAVAAFERTLKLDPANVKAEDNLGLTYAALERKEEAVACYKRAMQMQEQTTAKNAGPYLDYGTLLVDNEQVEQGIPLLLQAASIAPNDYQVHRELGKAYLHLNQLAKAQSELERAIELAPKNAPLHFMLAQVYRKEGFTDKMKLETERYTALK